MKHLLLITIISFISLTSNISMGQNHELNKLDKQTELLLDSAAKHMVGFILTQNASEYDLAVEKANRAEVMNDDLIAKNKKGLAGKIENEILDERKEEIKCYKSPTLKDDILSEKPADRKEKVKHKGKPYTLGAKSKKAYDTFNEFLPVN